MALYVYVTKECEEDAKEYARHDEVMRFKEKVESTQRTCHFDNFPPSPYLKKRFDRQFRLLAICRKLTYQAEEHLVVCFLRILVRSSKEYEQFRKSPTEYGERFLAPLVSEKQLGTFIAERLREHPVPAKPAPSDVENHFLYRFLGSDVNRNADEFICESRHWLRAISDKRMKDRLLWICEGLTEIVNKTPNQTIQRCRDYQIVFRWIPVLNKIFLAGIARDDAEKGEIEKRYGSILTAQLNEIAEEEVLRNSVRTYPAVLLADEDAWMDIQKDIESNLALSPEETDVLESVHSSEGGYPIFINGRAGSGKSTILYYLFADYVNLYLELKPSDEHLNAPLLLSCSHELRRQAEKTVTNLIRCNPRWQRDNADPEIPGECFQEFRSFLRGLLPLDEREDRFAVSKYIDYARFRRMWQTNFGKNKRVKSIGSDLSWHVIRTYIKGTNSDDYLEPDEYEHLPRKQKSVSHDTFVAVYENVWEAWYKEICEQEDFWDDQDLARRVFDSDLAQPLHPAVFCDEAQDFTRVELDLIFSLCVFTGRKLKHEDIRRVPFAFAGDPFQTLNPTGFRWDAIQALYHDKIVDTLGENLYKQIDLHYKELSLNYRSTKNIVRLCNLVQAFRAAVFDISTLRPQQSWQAEDSSPMPVWFDRGKVEHWNQLREEKDVTVIVPCMLNEEQEFVEKDEFLKSVVQTDELGTPVNVLSPARAKGLEFGRVVLYGFAGAAPEKLFQLLETRVTDSDRLLPFEYFVNQLYVAASRPKRRLFIIEDQEGRDSFWKIANDESLQRQIWKSIPEGKEIWADHVGGFEIGTKESWSEDRGNPEENARRFEQQGMTARDPLFLRSAAMSYENLNQPGRARLCRAYALKFEEKYLDAGDAFQRAGEANEALECYWIAGIGAQDRIIALHTSFPDIGNRLEYRLIQVMLNPAPKTIAAITTELSQRVTSDDGLKLRLGLEPAFKEIIWTYAKHLKEKDATGEYLPQFLTASEILISIGLPSREHLLAELYFKTKHYSKAVEWWESGESPFALAQYKTAKAIILAGAFQDNPELPITQNEGSILAEHFIKEGKYLLATRLLLKSGKVIEVLDSILQVPDSFEGWQELLLMLTDNLARRGEWGTLIDLAEQTLGQRSKESARDLRAKLKLRTSELRNAVVIACATQSEFSNQNPGLLKRFSDYFKSVLMTTADWRNTLTLEVVGAAIEGSGRQVDALQFYEQVMKGRSFKRLEKEFARKRWVVTKEKQAKRESEAGHEQAAVRYSSEASEKRREYGLEGMRLPDLPNVETLWVTAKPNAATAAADSPPDQNHVEIDTPEEVDEFSTSEGTKFQIGDLRFEYAPAQRRVNITNTDTMDTANIRTDVRALRSSDVDIRGEGHVFVCDTWESDCSFSSIDGLLRATFRMKTLGISVTFDFADNEKE